MGRITIYNIDPDSSPIYSRAIPDEELHEQAWTCSVWAEGQGRQARYVIELSSGECSDWSFEALDAARYLSGDSSVYETRAKARERAQRLKASNPALHGS